MKGRFRALTFFFFSALMALGAQERIAVLDTVIPEGIDKKVIIPVTEKLMEQFVASKLFIVLDRSFIQKTLSEKSFSVSDLVANDERLSELGGFLKATYIVVSTVQRIDTQYFISAKMIQVSTGIIIAQASDDKSGTAVVLIEMAKNTGQSLVYAAMGEKGGARPPAKAEVARTDPERTPPPKVPPRAPRRQEPENSDGSYSFMLVEAGYSAVSMQNTNNQLDYFSLSSTEELVAGYGISGLLGIALGDYLYIPCGMDIRFFSYDGLSWSDTVTQVGFSAGLGLKLPFNNLLMFSSVRAGYLGFSDSFVGLYTSTTYEFSGLPLIVDGGLVLRLGNGDFLIGARFQYETGDITNDNNSSDVYSYTGFSVNASIGVVF